MIVESLDIVMWLAHLCARHFILAHLLLRMTSSEEWLSPKMTQLILRHLGSPRWQVTAELRIRRECVFLEKKIIYIYMCVCVCVWSYKRLWKTKWITTPNFKCLIKEIPEAKSEHWGGRTEFLVSLETTLTGPET